MRGTPPRPVIRDFMTRHPGVEAKLLIGRDAITSNPKLNNLDQGMARTSARLGRHGRQQRADAARLPAAAAFRLARRHRASCARRPSAACRTASGPRSSAPSSTPIRRAGSTPPTRSASASRRARPCCGAAPISNAPAASARSAPRSPRMRRRPRSCAAPASACASSIAPSGSRWGPAARGRSGPAGALVEAAPRHVPRIFPPRGALGRLRRCSRRSIAAEALDVSGVGALRRARRRVVRLRSAPRARRRMAHEPLSPLAWVARDPLLPVLWVQAWLLGDVQLARQRDPRRGQDAADLKVASPRRRLTPPGD